MNPIFRKLLVAACKSDVVRFAEYVGRDQRTGQRIKLTTNQKSFFNSP